MQVTLSLYTVKLLDMYL